MSDLVWKSRPMDGLPIYEAEAGDFQGEGGVKFLLERRPSCDVRGEWALKIETSGGYHLSHEKLRSYHKLDSAKTEANCLAAALQKNYESNSMWKYGGSYERYGI